jgi:hypothetical protein
MTTLFFLPHFFKFLPTLNFGNRVYFKIAHCSVSHVAYVWVFAELLKKNERPKD